MRTKCFPRCHMTLEEHGLYTYAVAVSYETGKFYLSGPKVAKEYRDTGRNVIYRVGQLLIELGWFEVISPRFKDRVTGLWRPSIVRPRSHAEWTANYGESDCRPSRIPDPAVSDPCTKTGMEGKEPCTNSSMHGFEPSMHDSVQSMHGFEQSMHENVNKIRSGFRSKKERESERAPKAETPLAPTTSQINGQVSELKSWMLGVEPPLKFLPASKDKEHEATKTIIARRLKAGISLADIKSAIERIPLDHDPNPSFAIRDSLDAAIDRIQEDRQTAHKTAELMAQCLANEQAKARREAEERAAKEQAEADFVEETLGA
jgi:hypothetical protein